MDRRVLPSRAGHRPGGDVVKKPKPDGSHDNLPPDPEFDDTTMEYSLGGMHDMAVLLGTFRRELIAQGFTKKEACGLCETWLVETFSDMNAEEAGE